MATLSKLGHFRATKIFFTIIKRSSLQNVCVNLQQKKFYEIDPWLNT
jgi:hypothetical protein